MTSDMCSLRNRTASLLKASPKGEGFHPPREWKVIVTRADGSALNAPVLNTSFWQSTFEMPTELNVGEEISVQYQFDGLLSNRFFLTLREPGVSPFLFNGNEAVVQNGATVAIVTEANPPKSPSSGRTPALNATLRVRGQAALPTPRVGRCTGWPGVRG